MMLHFRTAANFFGKFCYHLAVVGQVAVHDCFYVKENAVDFVVFFAAC